MLALGFGVLYVVVVFVAEPILLRRRTGRSAWLSTWGATGWERTANAAFAVGCALDLGHPVLALSGVLQPLALPITPVVTALVAGSVFASSLVLAVVAQQVMGAAWRTGIAPDEPTGLVTSGPFRLVRNPTYTSLVMCSFTLAVLVPTWLAAVAVLVCLGALQIQTRLVEEPHLRQVHGETYGRYARAVGRFAPGLGRLSG